MRKPTALHLCEVYHLTQPQKICNLRPDSLALMLNVANINYQSRVLVVENTKGFLCGVLIEKAIAYGLRIDFTSDIVNLQDKEGLPRTVGMIRPNVQIQREFNFDPSDCRRIGHLDASILLNNDANSPDVIARQIAQSHSKMFNSCLIVHDQFLPVDIAKATWFALQPSATICVFSSYVQPLADLQDMLIDQKTAVNVVIEELWTREHQVLPMRTHPNMSMHAASGYILSAVKVA